MLPGTCGKDCSLVGFSHGPLFPTCSLKKEGFVSRWGMNRSRAPSPCPTRLLSKRSKQHSRYDCCHVFAHFATVIGDHLEQRRNACTNKRDDYSSSAQRMCSMNGMPRASSLTRDSTRPAGRTQRISLLKSSRLHWTHCLTEIFFFPFQAGIFLRL